ncbi:MAG TPA: hypothetical protein VFO38_01020 [Candidatus Saccharimonadales bacterium]|nr:hypothetical protein [Candidatus Saccharimonadales bacterium]
MDFQPTELQKQFCVDSLNEIKEGAGDALQDNPGALYAVFLVTQRSLKALAAVGKAAVRGGTSDCTTMMQDYKVAFSSMPPMTAATFMLPCLKNAYQPRILARLDEVSMRERFVALSEIANGL